MTIAVMIAATTMATPRPDKTRQPQPRPTENCQRYHNPDTRVPRDKQINYCPVCGQRLQQAPPTRPTQPTAKPQPRSEKKRQATFGNRR